MELSDKYDVYPGTIRKILNGKLWKHVYNKYADSVPHKPRLKRAPNKPAIKGNHKKKSKETNKKVVKNVKALTLTDEGFLILAIN